MLSSDQIPVWPFEGWDNRISPWVARLRDSDQPGYRVRTHNGDTVWLVTQAEVARACLADPRMSRRAAEADDAPRQEAVRFRPPGTPGNPTPVLDDPARRRVFRHALSPQAAAAQRQHAARAADRLVARVRRAGSPADLCAEIAVPLPFAMTVRAQLGDLPPRMRRDLHTWAETGLTGVGLTREEIETAWTKLHQGFTDWFADPAHLAGDHLMARLHRAAGEQLTPHQLAEIADMLWVAGYETTVGFLTNACLALLTHRGAWEELRAQPDLIPPTVDELLRYTPLATGGTPRLATEDAHIAGLHLTRGECAVVSYEAANHDPRAFPEPDRLDIHRQPREHLGFGHGPHRCVGHHLARMQIETALRALLHHLPTLRLATSADQLTWHRGKVIRTPHTLPVTW
ncbi:nocardicin N-oxygenase [Saccharopolyspora antimicrobica]|uniref:Nocardicin N-oxygenase n=1 Tax=Saccharopolyspora antimicrobica TaxID=455193 RepID=A0A1I4QUW6_9PSEU|nr:cytochrome P450 [Saccharopolyspora antimicrobica]RKT88289.1 nocardicin N-oxygenase [Saccharopolyspora antimicrobica]SFM43801.1 nocardicin N-oxygenase [Saccharopolyspora antimicrobica]